VEGGEGGKGEALLLPSSSVFPKGSFRTTMSQLALDRRPEGVSGDGGRREGLRSRRGKEEGAEYEEGEEGDRGREEGGRTNVAVEPAMKVPRPPEVSWFITAYRPQEPSREGKEKGGEYEEEEGLT
jgi:hypothetical protein